jgi:hypothetical protein
MPLRKTLPDKRELWTAPNKKRSNCEGLGRQMGLGETIHDLQAARPSME